MILLIFSPPSSALASRALLFLLILARQRDSWEILDSPSTYVPMGYPYFVHMGCPNGLSLWALSTMSIWAIPMGCAYYVPITKPGLLQPHLGL